MDNFKPESKRPLPQTAAIECRNVWKIFGKNVKQARLAVKERNLSKERILGAYGCVIGVMDASFSVNPGEIFCIMGLSGSGKSTLMRHINRLIEPTEGQILINGIDINQLSESEMRKLRSEKMGMVFQNMALLPHRNVRDNVSFGLELRKVPRQKRYESAEKALELSSKLKKTTLFITHDLDEAIRIGDHIAIMKDGVLVQTGTPEEIVTNPADDYVEDFVAGISRLHLVRAQTVMYPVTDFMKRHPEKEIAMLPTVNEADDLDQLVEIMTEVDVNQVAVASDGKIIGVVTRRSLLRGIQGKPIEKMNGKWSVPV